MIKLAAHRLIGMLIVIFILINSIPSSATNIVTYSVSDSASVSSEKLIIKFRSITNESDRTRISFDIGCSNAPFTIYRAEWVNCDSVYLPSDSFSLIGQTNEVSDKSVEWHVSLDFPFKDSFEDSDVLVLYTDKGILRCPTSTAGELMEAMDVLCCDYETQIGKFEKSSRLAWFVLTGVLAAGGLVFVILRRRYIKKRKEVDELSLLIAEKTTRNLDLEAKVDELYRKRFDTLNMLCNEYFEKRDSDKVRLSLFNEVEKYIMALRDPKSLNELETVVDSYLDNILTRLREQMPALSRTDRQFITYLYAGFSPRAVCLFTDIKLKNFYNRRSRLKDRILASDAPDKDFFVSKI